jgi:hypothetical protein
MRVLVTGGRDYNDFRTVSDALDELRPTVIIQGECPYGGADALAARYAEMRGIPCIGVRAHFRTMGGKAGPIRNGWMLRHAGPVDTVLAFPGDRGTRNMIDQADRAGIHVTRVGYAA